MKIVVNRDALINGLQKVQSIAVQKSTIPILENVLLKAEGDSLWLTTTDLSVSIRTRVDATVEGSGGITVPARRLFGIVRELPGSTVELNVDGEQVQIQAAAVNIKLIGLSEKEFPSLPEFDDGKAYTLEQPIFKDMLRKVEYACSTDKSRPYLNGVNMEFNEGKLSVVGSDGKRLALVEQDVEFSAENKHEYIVPTKTVTELLRTLSDEGELAVQGTENQIAFSFSDLIIVSKLVEGPYPNFRQVIPADCKQRVTILREDLLHAIRRAALVTTEQSNSVKMIFDNNQLAIIAQTPDVGESSENLPIKYSGDQISFSFNPEFVSDPLRALDQDEIYVELTDDLSPGVIKCDVPFLYVLMPIRIG